MKRSAVWVFFLVLFLTANCGFAFADDGQRPPPAPHSSAPSDVSDANTQVLLLKQQVEATKAYQESLLATVYWALGGVFGIALLLVGFGWFANFKVYERDKRALKSELLGSINESILAAHTKLEEHVKELSQQVNSDLEEKILAASKPINVRLRSLAAKVDRHHFYSLKRYMRAATTPSIKLTRALRVMELCQPDYLEQVPDLIKLMLDNIDNGGKMTADEMTDLNVVLDGLPKQFRTLSEKLSAKLLESTIF